MSATGRQPTEKESFFLQWGQETLKLSISRADEALSQVVTLSIGLAGGGLVALDKSSVPEVVAPWVVFLLLLAASTAFLGATPRCYSLDLDDPAEIETHMHQLLRRKSRGLALASFLLVLALGLGLAGVVHGLLCDGS